MIDIREHVSGTEFKAFEDYAKRFEGMFRKSYRRFGDTAICVYYGRQDEIVAYEGIDGDYFISKEVRDMMYRFMAV